MKNIISIAAVLLSIGSFAQKPVFTTAKVKAATVYFNSAEISQTTSAILPKGTSEIVVKNVADYLNENTVQIGAPSSVTVLSVQFTNNYMSEFEIDEKNPETKKVRDSITYITKEIKKLGNAKTAENNSLILLDKNQQVFGLNSGLSVLELTKLMDFAKTKSTESRNSIDIIDEKIAKSYERLANLNKKLEVNTKNDEKSSNGKLILQVMNEVAGNVDFDINYFTQNATWTPFYDLRANSISVPIEMMYKAKVVQNTGIDWKKVKLTLSSGNPNQNNQAPTLGAWWLQYKQPIQPAMGYMNDDVELSAVMVTSARAIKKEKPVYAAASIQADIIQNQLNISFDIDIPYDILSNGKEHSVALKEIKLPASYKYFAAPRVEKEAFLLAEINDYSKYNLLQGEANIIFEGMYVGKTIINPNQTADTLSLSMGRDKSISIKRDKVVDKSGTKFLSSKKEQTFTFDITLRNNKKEAVELKLQDQIPLSPDKEIEIELLESNNGKLAAETGILTWDLNLKPSETKKIRISYKVRYPKDRTISNL